MLVCIKLLIKQHTHFFGWLEWGLIEKTTHYTQKLVSDRLVGQQLTTSMPSVGGLNNNKRSAAVVETAVSQ